MFFVCYVIEKNVKEELFFCSELEIIIKVKDVMVKVEDFFYKENISWVSLCGVCIDGVLVMLGVKSGFQMFVKNKVFNVVIIYCFIYCEVLVLKILFDGFKCVFDVVVKSVNYIKNSVLNI